MTLIAAIKVDNGVVIGSDGVIADIGERGAYGHPGIKLWRWAKKDVVWGYAGIPATGMPFGQWLADQDFPTWRALQSAAPDVVKRINDEQTARTGDEWVGSSVLMAGKLDYYDILVIARDGASVLCGERSNSAAIGLNEIPAKVAWDLLEKFREEHHMPSGRHAEGFGHFLDLLLPISPGLGQPVGLWEIVEDRPPRCLRPESYAAALATNEADE